jgi:hypothetical protein
VSLLQGKRERGARKVEEIRQREKEIIYVRFVQLGVFLTFASSQAEFAIIFLPRISRRENFERRLR